MEESLEMMLIGLLIGSSLLIHWGLRESGVPALVGYLLLGILVAASNVVWGYLPEKILLRLDFLGNIGLVILLFHVGLKSDLAGLMRQLQKARTIWLGDVLVSGSIGYLTAHYLLGFELLASLYIAAALTATSIGVSVVVWQETGTLDSANGQTLVDVAEMDDVSAIILMSLILAITPVLQDDSREALLPTLLRTSGYLLCKLLLLGALCYAFARFVEHRLTRFYERITPTPDPMLMLVATGFVVAAIAGMLGFSIAVGAFLAGLVFSRDPEAIALTKPYSVLYDLFTPFFFIAIGLQIDPHALASGAALGAVLLVAAVLGKLLGAGGAAIPALGWNGALLLGLSMIPRAEIAMILMRQGHQQGPAVVPENTFAAMVFVSATTCIVSPLVLRPMLSRQSGKR